MNERRLKIIFIVLLVLPPIRTVWAESARTSVQQGNRLYAQGNFSEAISTYEQALLEKPEAQEPEFNKANSYYRLDDLAGAMDLYKEVAAESKDMRLVTKAKYNLGNCFFQRGLKQRDSDLQKALEDLKTSITQWRQVLDIDPKNEKAAKNIEVARLIIKDIIDQINKQKQQDPNQPQDPNQGQSQQQQRQQQQQGSQQDPNQPQDPNQSQQQQKAQEASGQDPNQTQGQQPEQQQQEKEAADATAQEILDKEQRQKQQRQILQRAGYQKVDKDW